jgi:hypothetical protein
MTQRLINIVMGLILAVVTYSGWAADDIAELSHEHSPHTTIQLAPIPDTLWETDAPLREGMQRINSETAQPWLAYQQHGLTTDIANALAKSIEDDVAFMITNCKLDPEADAALHGLLTELLAGAAEIKLDPHAVEGMPRITHALEEYPRYFLHPDWSPIQDKH